ncbi:MAG: 3-isopropylmalate dehydratase [Deltaproteobacteria bacterium]|nr:3-isopropylmalate dehydratase [Deltaproteobacteria bacterium]
MNGKLKGRAWIFDGVYDVDWEICPVEHMRAFHEKSAATYEERLRELGTHCMTKVAPDFPSKVRPGDFIVAGEGFGYGHDHDHACMSLRGAGIGAVIGQATNVNFQRNSIHHGLPVVTVKGILGAVREGDELELDLAAGVLRNLTSGSIHAFEPYPPFLLSIIEAGGLYQELSAQVTGGLYE